MAPPLTRLRLVLPIVVCTLFWVVCSARAESLPKFTGYTRPGIKKVAEGKEYALGVTVYYQVYDREGGKEGDPWQTGWKDLAADFIPGKWSKDAEKSPDLDTKARYLYLYQVVHDGDKRGKVASVAIPLEPDRKSTRLNSSHSS